MKVPYKEMTIDDYYSKLNELKKGYLHQVTMYIPDAVYKEVQRIAMANGMKTPTMVVHLISMIVLLYDIETLTLPIVRLVNEDEKVAK